MRIAICGNKNVVLSIVVLILLIITLIISLNIHKIYESKNLYRHKNADSLYAHFSMIDTYNYFIFPKLILASPRMYTLTSGQSLYIPKHWWHWVKTIKKHLLLIIGLSTRWIATHLYSITPLITMYLY